MTRLTAALIVVLMVLGAQTAAADVGSTYVTAYSRPTGAQAKAGKYGAEMLIKLKREAKKSKKTGGMNYVERIQLCKRTFYTTSRGKQWLAAHRRAKHVLVVRRHTAKGKYRVICGKRPMRKGA